MSTIKVEKLDIRDEEELIKTSPPEKISINMKL